MGRSGKRASVLILMDGGQDQAMLRRRPGGGWPDRAGDSQAVEEEGERMSQVQLRARLVPGFGGE